MTHMQAAEAHIYVADVAAACAFYGEKLGFSTVLRYGSPPHFALVQNGAARLALRLVCEPVFVGDIRVREELLSASLLLARPEETRALFSAYQAAGVTFQKSIGTRPWGALDFIVRDPDGNLLQFVSPDA